MYKLNPGARIPYQSNRKGLHLVNQMKKFLCYLFTSTHFLSCYAEPSATYHEYPSPFLSVKGPSKIEKPWFTGAILSGSAATAELGETIVEPRLQIYKDYGRYDGDCNLEKYQTPSTLINPVIKFYYGFAKNWDLGFNFSMYQTFYGSKNYLGFGDTFVTLRHILSDETQVAPQVAMAFQVGLPTGNYHYFDPVFSTMDGTGAGAYMGTLSLRLEKNILMPRKKWMRIRYETSYTLSTEVQIKGRSVYNTTNSANGRVKPGNAFLSALSAEVQLTQNWVFAATALYSHVDETPFTGYPGDQNKMLGIKGGKPSSEQISLAPALEYNFSEKFGMIAGVWFTCFGRHSSAFYTEVLNFNYRF